MYKYRRYTSEFQGFNTLHDEGSAGVRTIHCVGGGGVKEPVDLAHPSFKSAGSGCINIDEVKRCSRSAKNKYKCRGTRQNLIPFYFILVRIGTISER